MTSIHERFLARRDGLEVELGFPVFVSGLTGPLRIFQREGGHRHSIDDALTAWYALQKGAGADRVLDLGTGIGTVGLITLWGLGTDAKLTCVEAQEVSYGLLRANIECNGLSHRVVSLHGDLRDLDLEHRFPLITGSPPYFPRGEGTLPEDTQKAHARFELRGHVGDYAAAARRHLEEDGVFVFCFPFLQKERCIRLVEEEGFRIMGVRDVYPRRDRPPLFSVYWAQLGLAAPFNDEGDFVVAEADGSLTPEMLEVQASRGFGPNGTNVVS